MQKLVFQLLCGEMCIQIFLNVSDCLTLAIFESKKIVKGNQDIHKSTIKEFCRMILLFKYLTIQSHPVQDLGMGGSGLNPD